MLSDVQEIKIYFCIFQNMLLVCLKLYIFQNLGNVFLKIFYFQFLEEKNCICYPLKNLVFSKDIQ